MPKAERNLTAPDFPEGLEWLNAEKPFTLSALRGKVVLLDFWTSCCINCMHNIPDLKRLEAEYAEELVVVGVHSAKIRRGTEDGERPAGRPAIRNRTSRGE